MIALDAQVNRKSAFHDIIEAEHVLNKIWKFSDKIKLTFNLSKSLCFQSCLLRYTVV